MPTKNMRIQVLMDPETYISIKNFAEEAKVPFKNDSQMFLRLLKRAVADIQNLKITEYCMKTQIGDMKEKIKVFERETENLRRHNDELRKENEIFTRNQDAKKNKKQVKK